MYAPPEFNIRGHVMNAFLANTAVAEDDAATKEAFSGAANRAEIGIMRKKSGAKDPLEQARKIVRHAIATAKRAYPETKYATPALRAGIILKTASDVLGKHLYSPEKYKKTDPLVWTNALSLKKAMEAALNTSNVSAQAAALHKIEEVVERGSNKPWRHAGIPNLVNF